MTKARTRDLFTTDQIARIESTIGEVERRTTCELVVAIAPRADAYDRAADITGLIGSVFALALGAVITAAFTPDPVVSGSWASRAALPIGLLPATALVLGGFVAGVALARAFPRLALSLVPRRQREASCAEFAEAVFQRLRVRRTADASGVLILVSLLEHDVRVVPDDAARDRLDQGRLEAAARSIAGGFRDARGGDALADAIHALGDELAAKLPAGDGHNPDELPNTVHLL